ncbi:MAG: hypothetical protein A3F84_01400 [Candidatus Handelsmanbacteria bacterium RIFCSPLOWO2_12_FULL_64_10]|uniref:Beta-hexosaminidase bacterial type N-terminal domain-containing protein n=1 Tax=Handelsmanbacteria sp. (strain RIFCSPLOWO2_12_FULL_64_10) TaxID=1817868 RepID=A0A1F6D3Z9_HANXR|nr:MAG: hypothetical protein A3F84_01400 [Candidatus Handelsmanbacteria bacterium RIFCSPLOWO2_12_FULL_64_10]
MQAKVTPRQEKAWLRRLIPLPHEISIPQKITSRPEDVSVRLRRGAGEIERHAASELKQLFLKKAGVRPSGKGFEVVIGVVDGRGRLNGIPVGGAERLRDLPNRGQAYLIQPDGTGRLLLTGLEERGVYYAVRTLCQLLEPFLSEMEVSIPLARVVDWPDLEERGLWNFPDPETWVPWMSSLKLNYGKMAATRLRRVERGKRNRAAIDARLMREGRLRGFNYLPYILHLNFLHDTGLLRAYPELAGKGEGALAGRYFAHKQGNRHRAPCASNPLLAEILAEWMEDIASQGATEVSCWLSERPAQCGCRACTAVGQFVLESRAFVRAWRRVRRCHPGLQVRIFLSTTTLERDHRVLAELPPEVKVERACATEMERVLCLPRDLFVLPLFDRCAAQGRWIASYDVPLTANARVDTPEFKLPERSAHRVRDYVGHLAARNYRGAYGMMAWATQAREICGFNISALAEWSWNLRGRGEREFAVAWATREGYRDPEAVGEWAELMGPVAFDAYDSDFPICYSWGKAVALVRGRRRPCIGEGMFRYYVSVRDFDQKIATCRKALRIAKRVQCPDLAHETGVVMSYVGLAKSIYQVAEQVATEDLSRLKAQERLRASLNDLERAGAENVAAIRAWRSALGPEPWHYRVHDAIRATEATVQEICRFVSERCFY